MSNKKLLDHIRGKTRTNHLSIKKFLTESFESLKTDYN